MDIGETGLAGQVAWFQFLAGSPAVRTRVEGTGLGVVTGLASNSDNGIVLDRAALRDEHAVRDLVGRVLEHRVPASLVLAEPVPEAEIGVLLELGLGPEQSAIGMGRTIARWAESPPPTGVRIDEVGDDEALHAGVRALGTGWFDEAEARRYLSCYAGVGYGPGQRLRHWTATREDGRVVGMATSFRFADVVVLMHCGVVEPERRRGIATALTAARLQAAADDGATQAVLSPSPDGYQLHRHLGFEVAPVPPNRWFYLPVTER